MYPGGFKKGKDSEKDKSLSEDEFFPEGKLISKEYFDEFKDKILTSAKISMQDKTEIMKKFSEFVNTKEFENIALNKTIYENYKNNFFTANFIDLVEALKYRSIVDLKADVPFTKVLFDLMLAKLK